MMTTSRSLALGLALTLSFAAPARCEQIGDWTLEIDPMTEMVDPLREEVEKTGAPFTIEA